MTVLRVLHVTAGNLYGGVETLLVTLARCRELCPAMEPHFALCFEGRLSADLEQTGVPVNRLGPVRVSRPWTVWRARRRLARVLRREAFHAVVCHGCWPHAVFAPVVRRAGLALVFTAHGAPTGRHWLERWAARTPPDLVLANSRYTQAAVPALFPGVRSEVWYLPVAAPPPMNRADVRRQVRQDLNTPPEATVIVLACRLEPWKGHGLLLDALAWLRDSPGWVCWIAGGPQRPAEAEYLAKLRHRAHELGLTERLRFLGQRTDVARLYAAADIHCQPNAGPEPFGIAFIEALYAGLPVVTTALGGALEIVDESCGLLAKPGDAVALQGALRRLLSDPKLRCCLSEGGPGRARALCDPILAVDRLYELLQVSIPSGANTRKNSASLLGCP